GPPSMGHHALLAEIADRTRGRAIPAEDGPGAGAMTMSTRSTSTAATLSATLPGFPATLDNRLADIYKNLAEEIARQQRLWEVTDTIGGQFFVLEYEVNVEPAMREAVFTVNWQNIEADVDLTITRPDGSVVLADDSDADFRSDRTHRQVEIKAPEPGLYRVQIEALKGMTEFVGFLAGQTPVIDRILIGLTPPERVANVQIPLLLFLGDSKPVAGADVLAAVQAPNGSVEEIVLRDDGLNGDGKADDGVYGGYARDTEQIGSYAVKVRSTGTATQGYSFERLSLSGFSIRPLVAYVYQDDQARAQEYEKLLEANGFGVETITLSAVPTTAWERYSLLIIGEDTGDLGEWGTSEALAVLPQYNVPVIGVGDGGYAYFGKLGLNIGWPLAASGGSADATNPQVTFPLLWARPYDFEPARLDGELKLYNAPQRTFAYPDERVMLRHSRLPSNQTYAQLVQSSPDGKIRGDEFMWGFNGAPSDMTDAGRQLFVNTAYWMAR
ncbi:hypothetical protein HC891_01530, partial [Candidatus Gracilibacteria bacterium]|nr:hypothetical protein [Candidatus Gracilibacteria bacterium]